MKAWQATLTQLAATAILSYFGYWYTLAVPAFLVGAADRGATRSVWVGLGSTLGVGLALLAHTSTGGLRQAALLSTIVGVPGQEALPLLLTLLYPFVLGLLAKAAGSSLTGKRGSQ